MQQNEVILSCTFYHRANFILSKLPASGIIFQLFYLLKAGYSRSLIHWYAYAEIYKEWILRN